MGDGTILKMLYHEVMSVGFGTKEYEKIFKAFANKRRLDIIVYLCSQKEAIVGDIAKKIKLSFKATSKHLIILSNANILDKEQRNLLVFYSIKKPLSNNIKSIIYLLSNSRE